MTGAQMKMYRALVAKAARARGLHSRGAVEAYRLKVLFEETGKRSSKEISSQPKTGNSPRTSAPRTSSA